MKQTLKVSDIRNKAVALQGINAHFPVKLNYAIAKNLKVLLAECDTAAAQNKKVLDEKASKDKNGEYEWKDNEIVFPSEKVKKEALKELDDIANLDVEVEIITIPMSVLEMCDTDKYDVPTSKNMAALEFMIE